MRYKVINDFKDKEDNNTFYKKGEEYPKGRQKPTKKRIEELSKKNPEYKVAFIEEVKDKE
ncbi:hypothetical protein [Bacillus sp. 1P06AnD]|uniref:hypothetical protein n=1 Tax=Bacillus sp. 1P06AnD TaxID=3132208 RepID=UPI00399F3DE4